MTIRISKGFLMYSIFFLMITTFGSLYMAQSKAIYEEKQTIATEEQVNHPSKETNIRSENPTTHQSTQNGEVLGIVK